MTHMMRAVAWAAEQPQQEGFEPWALQRKGHGGKIRTQWKTGDIKCICLDSAWPGPGHARGQANYLLPQWTSCVIATFLRFGCGFGTVAGKQVCSSAMAAASHQHAWLQPSDEIVT